MKTIKKLFISFVFLFSCHIALAQWQIKNSSTNQDLRGMHFISPTIGFAVGDNGVILKTIDGGNNWVQQLSPTTSNLLSIKFINSQIGYITVQDTFFLKSMNGGISWNIEKLDTITINPFSCFFCEYNLVEFYDDLNGFIVLSEGQFTNAKTLDGGLNWNLKKEGLSASYTTGISWPKIDTIYILDVNRKLTRSINGGNTWSEISLAEGNIFFYALNFIDGNTGFVVGESSSNNRSFINKTTDGGNSWISVLPDSLYKKRILAIDFDKNGNGISVGNGIILTTFNQGDNWIVDSLTFPFPGQLLGTKITPAGVFAYGSNGTILVNKNIVGLSNVVKEQISVELLPNPIKDKMLMVKLLDSNNDYELVIYSNTGTVVFRKSLYESQNVLNLDLPSGLYNYCIYSGTILHNGRIVID